MCLDGWEQQVQEFPETRDSLIVQVQNPLNREAWDQFALIYRPVIYRLARQKGMQDADAQDLAQQVLCSVSLSIGRWEKLDPPVKFRHWLRRVIRNAIVNALSRKPQDGAAGGSVALDLLHQHVNIDRESASQIEIEYRRELYLQAARLVRADVNSETWQAFELTTVDCLPIEEVARQLGKTPGNIYAARSRVMRRLRQAVQALEQMEL